MRRGKGERGGDACASARVCGGRAAGCGCCCVCGGCGGGGGGDEDEVEKDAENEEEEEEEEEGDKEEKGDGSEGGRDALPKARGRRSRRPPGTAGAQAKRGTPEQKYRVPPTTTLAFCSVAPPARSAGSARVRRSNIAPAAGVARQRQELLRRAWRPATASASTTTRG